jgi:hypothetical protein
MQHIDGERIRSRLGPVLGLRGAFFGVKSAL